MAILSQTEKHELYGLLKKLGLFAISVAAEAGNDCRTRDPANPFIRPRPTFDLFSIPGVPDG